MYKKADFKKVLYKGLRNSSIINLPLFKAILKDLERKKRRYNKIYNKDLPEKLPNKYASLFSQKIQSKILQDTVFFHKLIQLFSAD